MSGALSKSELFARLAGGHAAGIAVVTPTLRLARSLLAEFDAFQINKKLAVWEAADILYVDAFIQRLWEDALYSDGGGKLPLLLTGAQEQRLWEEILAKSDLLVVPGAAADCRTAWKLMHAWRIGLKGGNEDVTAFSSWSKKYLQGTKKDVDAARLPDLMASFLKKIKTPKLLVAYGFDGIEPQVRDLFSKFEWVECQPVGVAGFAKKAFFPSAGEELEHAARWARARLEAGRKRIAIVVPDLRQRRQEVVRVLTRVMGSRQPFNVSDSPTLEAYPLVACALSLIEFSMREIPFARASLLVRSPFLGAAEAEMARRAVFDARLRRELGATVSLPKLIALAESCPLLRELFEKIYSLSKSKPKTPGEWARHFSSVLDAAGFPGERKPDSEEFQTRAKWHEVLGEFAKLERVVKGFSSREAFSAIQSICANTQFQPESGDAPVQVLGALESKGLPFDCLWVCGLTDEKWPLAASPNPFLPIAAQKAAGISEASAEGSLEHCRRITAGWKAAAEEAVFSYPVRDGDRDLSPSPLILDIQEKHLEIREFPRHRDLIFASREITTHEDSRAPAFVGVKVHGGTKVLADQSACPFRAFARHRLAAQALDEPAPGLDDMQRGILVHKLMSSLWGELKSSSELKKNLQPAIERAAAAAVKELEIEGRFAELERTRLARLAMEWLDVEKQRGEFAVVAIEEKRNLKAGNLEFSGRIDRMDRLADGGHVLIDYKTGARVTPKAWEGPRPEEPQLPLYAVSASEKLTAVAFAKIRTGDMKFSGFSRTEDLVPGVKAALDWPALLSGWKKDADSLATSFAAGEASVDPKKGPTTCRMCDLHTLCRVYEKLNALEEGDEE